MGEAAPATHVPGVPQPREDCAERASAEAPHAAAATLTRDDEEVRRKEDDAGARVGEAEVAGAEHGDERLCVGEEKLRWKVWSTGACR